MQSMWYGTLRGTKISFLLVLIANRLRAELIMNLEEVTRSSLTKLNVSICV